VTIVVSSQEADGKYRILASPPIEMDTCSNHTEELLLNAEKVLAAAENHIRQAAHQWSMSLPVWPQIMDQVP
jgi:hypothetical protein